MKQYACALTCIDVYMLLHLLQQWTGRFRNPSTDTDNSDNIVNVGGAKTMVSITTTLQDTSSDDLSRVVSNRTGPEP